MYKKSHSFLLVACMIFSCKTSFLLSSGAKITGVVNSKSVMSHVASSEDELCIDTMFNQLANSLLQYIDDNVVDNSVDEFAEEQDNKTIDSLVENVTLSESEKTDFCNGVQNVIDRLKRSGKESCSSKEVQSEIDSLINNLRSKRKVEVSKHNHNDTKDFQVSHVAVDPAQDVQVRGIKSLMKHRNKATAEQGHNLAACSQETSKEDPQQQAYAEVRLGRIILK